MPSKLRGMYDPGTVRTFGNRTKDKMTLARMAFILAHSDERAHSVINAITEILREEGYLDIENAELKQTRKCLYMRGVPLREHK